MHFVEWLETARLSGIRIYHFGTGGHHHVGVECARPHLNNTVFGVTASPKEYKSYVDLVTRQPEVSKTYLAYFGDIYTSNSDLLPAFDVVTLFHLCEFRDESNSRYGAKTDAEVLDLFARHTARDGHLLFYRKPSAYRKAEPIIEQWAANADFVEIGDFRPCGFSARPRNSPFPRPAHAAARHALPDPDVSPGPHAAATARPAAQPERRARCVPPPDDAVQAARLPRPERARTAAVPAGRAQRKVFGITFDDGFLRVLTHAMPVLDALGFTATCYFVAGRFGGENDWDAAADTARSPLTHADMLAWRDHGHEIGSHTLDHVALSHVPAHVSEVQIVESKQRLEALSGQTVESFCYPYGDLDPRVRDSPPRVTATRRRPGAAAPICARRSVPVAADHGRGRRRCDAVVPCAKARVQRCR